MSTPFDEAIDSFLSQPAFAVAGASTNREKYGNKVVRVYQQNDRTVYPIHPSEPQIEGLDTSADVSAVPADRFALSIVTPPPITQKIVRAALAKGVRHFWMQPGAEDATAIEEAEAADATVIHGGPCVLVALGYRE